MKAKELTISSNPQLSWLLLPTLELVAVEEPTSSAFVLKLLRVVLSLHHIRRIL
jgi:hypothetical protein